MSATDPSGMEFVSVAAKEPYGDWIEAAAIIGYAIFVDFSNPFHGNVQASHLGKDVPNAAAPWNDTFGVPYPGLNGAIGLATGLPGAGCEFGACGAGPTGFSPGSIGANFSQITIDPQVLNLAMLMNWAFTGKHSKPFPDIHGNWCGPNGAGFPVDGHDWNCMTHDYCYQKNGFSMWSNFFLQRKRGVLAVFTERESAV